MSVDQNRKHAYYRKVAWAIYALAAIAVTCVLVLFVAQDDEERFFYGIMPLAAAYVLRPTESYINKLIFKFTGVSQPSDKQ